MVARTERVREEEVAVVWLLLLRACGGVGCLTRAVPVAATALAMVEARIDAIFSPLVIPARRGAGDGGETREESREIAKSRDNQCHERRVVTTFGRMDVI